MNDDATRHRINLVATTLLSISALATSWAGYQATKWSGDQAVLMNEANALRARTTLASAAAGQQRAVDVGVFTSWLTAYVHHDTALATVFEHRFRGEFKPAFNAWIKLDPLRTPNSPPTPLSLKEYSLAADDSADRLQRAADSMAAASINANATSDAYVLDVVLFAAVMFFAQSVQQSSRASIRYLLLVLGALLATMAIVRVIRAPID